jgi:hypothetical protein
MSFSLARSDRDRGAAEKKAVLLAVAVAERRLLRRA